MSMLRRLVEPEPAVLRRDVDHEQAELARLAQQLGHEAGLLRLDLRDAREDLAVGELPRGARDLALLLA